MKKRSKGKCIEGRGNGRRIGGREDERKKKIYGWGNKVKDVKGKERGRKEGKEVE